MFRVPKDTVMTIELLAEYIGKHKRLVNERLQKLQDAYENKYDIFDLTKIPKKQPYKPDNRISVNYAKLIVNTFNGFFMGVPVKITVKENSERADKISAFIEEIDRKNHLDNKNREIAKKSDILGSCNEIYFVDEDGEIGVTQVSSLESFFIYDESIRTRPLFFVRYYKDYKGIERGSYSDATIVQDFVQDGSYKWVGEPQEHLFDGVPATEYMENTERCGLFESEMSAMNEYNKAISEKANDVDYFSDAYLKILGPHVDEKDTTHMRSTRIINFEGDEGSMPSIDFMAKPNADTTQENLLNRLQADIFHASMVPDINDQNFGSVSGIALQYRLLSMSNLAKDKKGIFQEALARRYALIFSHPLAKNAGVNSDDWKLLDYHFTENYPANVKDEVEIARGLEGQVSKDTQLKVLSIVEDVQAEKDRMEEERKEAEKENIIDRMMFGKDVADEQ